MKRVLKKTAKNFLCFVTCANVEQAEVIATTTVNKNLAACANILEGVKSIFMWEGGLQNEKEVLLILKGNDKNREKLASQIRDLHSYEVPEIIFAKIDSGLKEYIDWLNKVK